MSPSLKRLQSFADVTIIIGPLLLIVGFLFAFSPIGILPMIGTAVAATGGILLLAGLTSRAVELGVRAIAESANVESPAAVQD